VRANFHSRHSLNTVAGAVSAILAGSSYAPTLFAQSGLEEAYILVAGSEQRFYPVVDFNVDFHPIWAAKAAIRGRT